MITYGTGAIMAVPAHDQRDFEFANAHDLPIRVVIQPERMEEALLVEHMTEAYDGPGVMVNSEAMDGSASSNEKGRKNSAIGRVIDWLEETGKGVESVNYRLHDWLISRQRYWGSPIPVTYDGGAMTIVADDDLPVELPEDVDFMPTGRSPLTYHEPFYKVNETARRETDTLDTFMCSSWYQLRYLSPENDVAPFDAEEAAYWLPVDVYTGGAEHAVMHLLYTRFFTKVLRDIGVFDDAAAAMRANGRDPERAFDEPMIVLRNQGQVLGAEHQGDYVLCSGRTVGGKMLANRVEVVGWNEVPAGFDGYFGEIAHRTENVMRLDMAGVTQLVQILPDADIIIPDIAGKNNINQLRHHLEIQRMSKSKGNVVNPDKLVEKYGADVVRCYLMFNFDWQKGGPWNENNIKGPQGWLHDVWEIATAGQPQVDGDPCWRTRYRAQTAPDYRGHQSRVGRIQFQHRHRRTDEIQEHLQGRLARWTDRTRHVARSIGPDDPAAGALCAPASPKNCGNGWGTITACTCSPGRNTMRIRRAKSRWIWWC